jgi:hypothetical protein
MLNEMLCRTGKVYFRFVNEKSRARIKIKAYSF